MLVDPPPKQMENLQLFLKSFKRFWGNSKTFPFFPLKDQKYLEKFQFRFVEGGGVTREKIKVSENA